MRHFLRYILLVLVALGSQKTTGQQLGLYSLYNQNMYLINPAAAGKDGCFSAFLDHRNQWAGINGSPVSNTLTIDGGFGKGHGIGLYANMDNAGLLKRMKFNLGYAYHLNLSSTAQLHAGMALGMVQQQFKATDAIASDYSDELLLQGNQSDMGFNSDIGVMLTTPRFTFGLSVPQVFTSGLLADKTSGNEFKLVNHFIAFSSYDIVSSEKWKLTPSVLYRNADFIGHQVDIAARATWNNTIGFGALYRTSYGLSGIVELNLKSKFKLGYSYAFGGGQSLTGISRGSHEVLVGIKLCKDRTDPIAIDVIETDTIVAVVLEAPKDTTPVVKQIVEEKPDIKPEPWSIDLDSLNRAFEIDDRIISYELNSSSNVISDNQSKVVNMVADILNDNSELRVKVIGHACNQGNSDFNQTISENRAAHIADAISKKGIPENRVEYEGKGSNSPKVSNDSKENRQKNRRVQIVFIK